ncbi:SDR family oxidoreductase [Arthrobacter sp. NPDC058127]|uniref:SDR family oxidoreductase n=1 Tax=Arthrobacter sp. NPDC058127 TaxID=3346351 RepID=UPI0036E8369D
MVRDWKNMNALVTGGGSGIGLDVTRKLLGEGAHVTIVGRSDERLVNARRQLGNEDLPVDRLHTVAADISVEDEIAAAVAAATSVTGQLNSVVACAGEPRGQMAPVTHLDLDQWNSIFNNNVVGTMLTLKHGARELVRSGGGSIVAISSISGIMTARFASPISAAKAALEQLVRIAAHELGPSNVTVNAIRPGLVEVERQGPMPEGMKQDWLELIPMGRLGRPRDLAGIAAFLVGPEAGWLTGQVFSVDGGQTLVRAFDASPWVEPMFGKDAMRGVV